MSQSAPRIMGLKEGVFIEAASRTGIEDYLEKHPSLKPYADNLIRDIETVLGWSKVPSVGELEFGLRLNMKSRIGRWTSWGDNKVALRLNSNSPFDDFIPEQAELDRRIVRSLFLDPLLRKRVSFVFDQENLPILLTFCLNPRMEKDNQKALFERRWGRWFIQKKNQLVVQH